MKAKEFDKLQKQTLNFEQQIQQMQKALPPAPGMQKKPAGVSRPARHEFKAVNPQPVEEQQPDPVNNDRVLGVEFGPNSLIANHKNHDTKIWRKMQNWD
jgi:hypothetical protein